MANDSFMGGAGTVGAWDAGVAYVECQKRIERALKDSKLNPIRVAKCVIYAIQLRNAARVSEATDALREFCRGVEEPMVLVRKKKKFKTARNKVTGVNEYVIDTAGNKIPVPPDYRAILWPKFVDRTLIKQPDVMDCATRITKKQAQDTCKALIGVNSHTLRYARITKLSTDGVNPNIIASITHHTSLDFILKYTQKKEAERINRDTE